MKKIWKGILLAFSVALALFALCALVACEEGSKKKDGAITPSHEHNFVYYAERQASCCVKGTKEHLVCMWCNKTFSNEAEPKEVSAEELETPLVAHTPVDDAAVAATCTKNGKTAGKHCAVCHIVLVEQQILPLTPHKEAIDNAVEPTCTMSGKTEGKHCSVCKKVLIKQSTLPARHTEAVDEAVAATCIKTGLTEGKHCSVCKTVLLEQKEIPLAAHTEEVDEAVAATCIKTGLTEGKHCSVCKTVLLEQKETPLAAHTEEVDEAVAATCTESGLTEGKHCSVCKTVLTEQEVVPITRHTWGNKACTVCGVDFYTEGMEYTLNEDGNGYTVSKVGTASGDIVIPAAYLGKPVTAIAGSAFFGCNEITGMTIPSSVTSIGKWALNSYALASIEVDSENPVYYSENNCIIETATKTLIAGCNNSVIPSDGSVTSIGVAAFAYCKSLTEITIPDSVTVIESFAFSHSNLKSVTIPNSVTRIGSAFYYCDFLESLTIGSGVTSIDKKSFQGSIYYLKSIKVDVGNTVYHSTDDCIIETATKTLILGCRNSKIPMDGSVTSIGDYAFQSCAGIGSITIPYPITSIGEKAFAFTDGLKSITIQSSVTSIGKDAFLRCYDLESITVESGNPVYHSAGNCLIETASQTLIAGCRNSVIPANGSVTRIADNVFEHCRTAFTEIAIPKSITSIGEEVFLFCSNLTSIKYEGTKEEWNAITKGLRWDHETGDYIVYCSDGKLDKEGNEIA